MKNCNASEIIFLQYLLGLLYQNYIYLLIVPVTACAQYGNICHCVVAGIF